VEALVYLSDHWCGSQMLNSSDNDVGGTKV
jgi:hypothetical protein